MDEVFSQDQTGRPAPSATGRPAVEVSAGSGDPRRARMQWFRRGRETRAERARNGFGGVGRPAPQPATQWVSAGSGDPRRARTQWFRRGRETRAERGTSEPWRVPLRDRAERCFSQEF